MKNAPKAPTKTIPDAIKNTVEYPDTCAFKIMRLVNCCISCLPDPLSTLCRAMANTLELMTLVRIVLKMATPNAPEMLRTSARMADA